MSQTYEQVTRDTAPHRRIEHELRYMLVAPLIREAVLWVDLGCGTGAAAADALEGELPERTLVVDVSEDALADAGRELKGAQMLAADLGTAEGAAAVRESVGDAGGKRLATCFETLAHLETFVPAVDLLLELGDRDFTVVVSVPNDAFWSIANPFHKTMWGEGSFEELRRLLPGEHVVLEQMALAGSAIAGIGPASLPLANVAIEATRVPSHYLLAFGPQAKMLAPLAAVNMTDAEESRRWERERASDLAFLQARVRQLERPD